MSKIQFDKALRDTHAPHGAQFRHLSLGVEGCSFLEITNLGTYGSMDPPSLEHAFIVGRGLGKVSQTSARISTKFGEYYNGPMQSDLVLLKAAETHALFEPYQSAPIMNLAILLVHPDKIRSAFIDSGIHMDFFDFGSLFESAFNDQYISQSIRFAIGSILSNRQFGLIHAETLAINALYQSLRLSRASKQDKAPKLYRLSISQVAKIIDLIESNLQDPISLKTLAREAGYSTFHFLRLFQNTFGLTPHAMILERRLWRAMQLIKNSKLGLSQIAVDCGFSDQPHMARMFFRKFKKTPGQIRFNF